MFVAFAERIPCPRCDGGINCSEETGVGIKAAETKLNIAIMLYITINTLWLCLKQYSKVWIQSIQSHSAYRYPLSNSHTKYLLQL